MALRAGYYGIKRGLKAKLAEIAGAWDVTVNSIYTKTENAIYGSYNIYNNTASSRLDHGVNMTVNGDKTVTFTGGPSTEAGRFGLSSIKLKANTVYYLTGCPEGGGEATSNYWLALYDGSTMVCRDIGNGVMYIPAEDVTLTMTVRVPNNWTPGSGGVTFKPMVALVKDAIYGPYAQTNQYLTLSADEQKDVINAIITAATGAADFAAFKTAMGAITPVTRSLSREASPEDVPKEVIEEEKPVTKKTTKKTVKEGE